VTVTPTGDTVKKLVIASAAMGGAALIAFGASGTFASYNDQTVQNVGAVAADSVVVNSWDKTTAEMASTPLSPGDSVVRAYYVRNSGTAAGRPNAQLLNVTNKDDGCTSESEKATYDDCDSPTKGDLAAQVSVGYTVFAPTGTDCVAPTTGYKPIGMVNDIIGTSVFAPTVPQLAAGAAECVAFQLTFVDGANNNKAQGDSFTAQIQFGLEQA
jgi:hypothetical protein